MSDSLGDAITRELLEKMPANKAYESAIENSSKTAVRLDNEEVLKQNLVDNVSDRTVLGRRFVENREFNEWLVHAVSAATHKEAG